MPCPKCSSNDLWDDMQWWGCQRCDFLSATQRNTDASRDRFNQSRAEIEKQPPPKRKSK